MKTESKRITDERLEELLRSARPEPDAEFCYGLRSALASLPESGSVTAAKVRHVPKAVIIIAVLLLALILGTGVAYASGVLRNLFGSAAAKVEERIEEFNETFDERREQMEHVDEWEAGMIDMELDYESEKNIGDLAQMREAEKNATNIEQEIEGVTLSSFSYMKLDEMNWMIYIGFNAESGFEYPQEIEVTVDQWKLTAYLSDFAAPSPEAENPAIYSCWPNRYWSSKSVVTRNTVELEGRSWSFNYHWLEARLAKPDEQASYADYIADERTEVTVISGGGTSNNITVHATGAEIVDEKLKVSLVIIVPESYIDKTIYISNMAIGFKGETYDDDDLISDTFAVQLKFDKDCEKHPTFSVWLPAPLGELIGEEFTYTLYLQTKEMPADQQISAFEFRLAVKE